MQKQAKKKVDGLPQNWVKVHDTEAGCDYYLNEMTGESAWELPEHLRAAEENGTLKEAELSALAEENQSLSQVWHARDETDIIKFLVAVFSGRFLVGPFLVAVSLHDG